MSCQATFLSSQHHSKYMHNMTSVKVRSTLQVFTLLLCVSLLVQAQECPSNVLVSPTCAPDIPPGNWTSCFSADEIRSNYVRLSWAPHPDIDPSTQRSYEIFWRRRTNRPPMEWRKTSRLEETEYDTNSSRLTYTFEELALNTMYEMRMCLAMTGTLPINKPPGPQCGYCTLRFNSQSRGSTLALTSATVVMESPNEAVLTCEAMGMPTPEIIWDVRRENGNRTPLQPQSNNYEILNSNENDTVHSMLTYDPEAVSFTRPECLIRNEIETLRVRDRDFEVVKPVTMTNDFTTRSTVSLTLTSATVMTSPNEAVLTCEAMGMPVPEITWDARRENGNRIPLRPESDNYEIFNSNENGFTQSILSYDPETVSFTRPECIITNGMETLRVRNQDFQTVTATEDFTAATTAVLPVWAIALLVVLPTLLILGVAITVLAVCCIRRKRRFMKFMANYNTDSNNYSNSAPVPLKSHRSVQSEASVLYGILETTLPKHMIIPSSDISVSTVVGQGQFGVVYKGILTRNGNQDVVAVKTLKGIFATPSDIQGFTDEILVLQQFNHPNVMSLIGVCLGANKTKGGPSIILPFMSKGSLLNVLRKEADRLRPPNDADVSAIGAVEKSLAQFCLQIAKGMEYLASQKFVHRDLAARNCMIDQNDQIRVGDFGLTEDIYTKNYFRQTASDGVKLPIKWMAPESLKLGVFNEKSDVWSYGITCWEVFSCGEIPYPGLHPQEVLPLLLRGERLSRPTNPACTDQLYSILPMCWNDKPEARKTFSELCVTLEGFLSTLSDYLDLNILAKTQSDITEDQPYTTASQMPGRPEGTAPNHKEAIQEDEGTYDNVADEQIDRDPEDSMYVRQESILP